MCFAAFVAWLAYARFDTRAGITLLPRRWADVGRRPIAVFVAAELAHSALVLSCGPAELRALRQTWVSTYLDGGQLLVGWLLAAKLASALAEAWLHAG